MLEVGTIQIRVIDGYYNLTIDGGVFMSTLYDEIEGEGETFEEALSDLLEQVRVLPL